MKKILALLGAVGLIATSAATVVACGNEESLALGTDLSAANVVKTFKVHREIGNDQPSDQAILKAFNQANKNVLKPLESGDVTIIRDQSTTVTISAVTSDNAKFTGSVQVTYTYANHIDLNDLNVNLGQIALLPKPTKPSNAIEFIKPTEQQILEAFINVNPGLDIELETDVNIKNITAGQNPTAIIEAANEVKDGDNKTKASEIVKNSVTVSFTTISFNDFFNQAKTDLGAIMLGINAANINELLSAQDVFEAFISQLNNFTHFFKILAFDQVIISDITANSAKIAYYTHPDTPLTLTFNVIGINLGYAEDFAVNDLASLELSGIDIEKAIKDKYQNLDLAQLESDYIIDAVDKESGTRIVNVTLKPKADSDYLGIAHFTITFKLKK